MRTWTSSPCPGSCGRRVAHPEGDTPPLCVDCDIKSSPGYIGQRDPGGPLKEPSGRPPLPPEPPNSVSLTWIVIWALVIVAWLAGFIVGLLAGQERPAPATVTPTTITYQL